jgi:hypothetical protein
MSFQSEHVTLVAGFYIIAADFMNYFYLFLKIFRVILYSKLTFDQMPTCNPYMWPFSVFRVSTQGYFRLWNKLLPNLRVGGGAYDISTIVGLEFTSCIINICYDIRMQFLAMAEECFEK